MLTTIRDLLRMALPPGSLVRTDEQSTDTPVRGVVSLRPALPAFPPLHGGEVALITPAQALALDERLTIVNLVERLAEVPVAALAIAGPIEDEAITRAERRGIALIELPLGSDLRLIERELLRLLHEPDLQIERRASQLYTELTQALVAGGGVKSVVALLGARTGHAVACFSASGRLRAEWSQGSEGATGRAVFQLLRLAPGEHHILGQRVLVRMIGTLGGLALAGSTLDAWDTAALEQGAAALALELAKEQAVKAAEGRVRSDLLRTILSGAAVDPESLRKQASELGFDLERPHLAVVCEPIGEDADRLFKEFQRIVRRRKLHAPLLQRDDSVVIFCPSDERDELGEAIEELTADLPLTSGISTPVNDPTMWPRALGEAEQALVLGRQLFGTGSKTSVADLGVYRLLLAQRDLPELRRFYQETLGSLVAHDGPSGELVTTLEGYFAELGNISRTAARLHIHRNTLMYRLQRISDITGVDWKHAEDQLSLQLALKAHRVLRLLDGASANGHGRAH